MSTHFGSLRRLILILQLYWLWSRPRVLIVGRIVVFLLAVGVLALLLGYFWPHKGSFVIAAETRGFEITFRSDSGSSWRIPDALFCFRREKRLPISPIDSVTSPCDPRLYETAAIPVAEITWHDAWRLRLTKGTSDSALEIFVLDTGERGVSVDGHSLRSGSRIILDDKTWANAGSFLFMGAVRVGTVPSPGASDHLISGRYEIRESLVLRDRPVTVRNGDFFPGDQITVVSNIADEAPPTVNGFVSASQADPPLGFLVLAYSPVGHNVLKIDRFGAEPARIWASWPERALNDPWLLGMSGLLVLFGIISQLLKLFATMGDNNRTTPARKAEFVTRWRAPSEDGITGER